MGMWAVTLVMVRKRIRSDPGAKWQGPRGAERDKAWVFPQSLGRGGHVSNDTVISVQRHEFGHLARRIVREWISLF